MKLTLVRSRLRDRIWRACAGRCIRVFGRLGLVLAGIGGVVDHWNELLSFFAFPLWVGVGLVLALSIAATLIFSVVNCRLSIDNDAIVMRTHLPQIYVAAICASVAVLIAIAAPGFDAAETFTQSLALLAMWCAAALAALMAVAMLACAIWTTGCLWK